MNVNIKEKTLSREERVAAALRENLKKRKEQALAQSRLRHPEGMAQSSRAETKRARPSPEG